MKEPVSFCCLPKPDKYDTEEPYNPLKELASNPFGLSDCSGFANFKPHFHSVSPKFGNEKN